MTAPQPIKTILCPGTAQEPRKVEATILPFEDGRLYLAYTAGERADYLEGKLPEGSIRILGRWSLDSGDSWSDPFLVREHQGLPNAMEPSFLRLPSGRILQAYMKRDTFQPQADPFGQMYPMVTYSDDECANWSEPQSIPGNEKIYYTTNNRLIALESGRIILPVLVAPGSNQVGVWISDDGGKTWRLGNELIKAGPGIRYGYPIAVELADGRVAMFLMNSTGCIHTCHRQDGAESWEPVIQSGPAPCPATFMVQRLPDSSDLVLVWNHHTQRTNLTTAISQDQGNSWSHHRLLESPEDNPLPPTYSFPSLAFLNGMAHMTWYRHPSDEKTSPRFDLVYCRQPISWFYGA